MNNKQLESIAKSVRKTVFEFKTRDGIGHLHSSLSPVDVLVSLFMMITQISITKKIS